MTRIEHLEAMMENVQVTRTKLTQLEKQLADAFDVDLTVLLGRSPEDPLIIAAQQVGAVFSLIAKLPNGSVGHEASIYDGPEWTCCGRRTTNMKIVSVENVNGTTIGDLSVKSCIRCHE